MPKVASSAVVSLPQTIVNLRGKADKLRKESEIKLAVAPTSLLDTLLFQFQCFESEGALDYEGALSSEHT
jgi:hypothetical protein